MSGSTGVFVVGVIALTLAHEAAHAVAAEALGLRWRVFAKLPWKVGIAVWVNTPKQRRLIGAAGPAANVVLALPLWMLGGQMLTLAVVSALMATLPSALDWIVVTANNKRKQV